MKRASSECRINAVAAVKITLEVPITQGTPKARSLVVDVAFLHSGNELPVLMGRSTLTTTWPDDIHAKCVELRDAIEDHLLKLHFADEGGRTNDNRDYPIDIPEGLGGSGLVSPENEPTQL